MTLVKQTKRISFFNFFSPFSVWKIHTELLKRKKKENENCSNILYYWIVKKLCMHATAKLCKCKLFFHALFNSRFSMAMNSIFHHLLLWAFSLSFYSSFYIESFLLKKNNFYKEILMWTIWKLIFLSVLIRGMERYGTKTIFVSVLGNFFFPAFLYLKNIYRKNISIETQLQVLEQ